MGIARRSGKGRGRTRRLFMFRNFKNETALVNAASVNVVVIITRRENGDTESISLPSNSSIRQVRLRRR
jgi:hypothetical protein